MTPREQGAAQLREMVGNCRFAVGTRERAEWVKGVFYGAGDALNDVKPGARRQTPQDIARLRGSA